MMIIALPALIVQILFFLLFSVFLVIGYILLHRKKHRLFIIAFAIMSGLTITTYLISKRVQCACIMHDQTVVRAGPGNEYHALSTLAAGTRVAVIKSMRGWKKIGTADGDGWVEDMSLKEIGY